MTTRQQLDEEMENINWYSDRIMDDYDKEKVRASIIIIVTAALEDSKLSMDSFGGSVLFKEGYDYGKQEQLNNISMVLKSLQE